ncbi:hypothetical protein AOR02nite_20760 [Acetobacter orientalis]|nr:hypothetical protein AOR02nite_20760 [Acetobacter orientalis]
MAMPMAAERVLPPITARGVASGLAGRAKTSTLEAPIGATMAGKVAGVTNPVKTRQAIMPHTAPNPANIAYGAFCKAVLTRVKYAKKLITAVLIKKQIRKS